MTREEIDAKCEAGEEKELQGLIRNYLRLRDIWFDWDSMHAKRRGTIGAADFLFAWKGQACAVEAKTVAGRISPEQLAAHDAMRANGWRVLVATSLREVIDLLDSI